MGFLTFIHAKYFASMMGYQLLTKSALAEFKAMYGGLSLAIATLLMISFRQKTPDQALLLLIVINLGLSGGRLIGIFGNHAINQATLFSFSLEVLTIIISTAFYLFNKKD